MRKVMLTLVALLGITMAKAESPVTVGVDLYSRYVWRGLDYGNSPSIQPTIKYTKSNFTIGGWGAYATTATGYNSINPQAPYKETDLFASYTLPFGITIGVTDFFLASNGIMNSNYFDYKSDSTSHAFEANLVYTYKGLSLTGSYVFNETTGAGSQGGDTYVEAKYTFENSVNFFVGGGNKWYTADSNYNKTSKFNICNVGVGATKTIKFTDSFSLPVNGSIIINPNAKQINFIVGISL